MFPRYPPGRNNGYSHLRGNPQTPRKKTFTALALSVTLLALEQREDCITLQDTCNRMSFQQHDYILLYIIMGGLENVTIPVGSGVCLSLFLLLVSLFLFSPLSL